jgi:hypothetical protein
MALAPESAVQQGVVEADKIRIAPSPELGDLFEDKCLDQLRAKRAALRAFNE